jgi:hypothetical protein
VREMLQGLLFAKSVTVQKFGALDGQIYSSSSSGGPCWASRLR